MKGKTVRNVERVCATPAAWLGQFRRSDKWTGPSSYFHEQTLNRLQALAGPVEAIRDTQYREYLYATLCAWGLHRMGRREGRLVEFEKFCQELDALSPHLASLQELHLGRLVAQQLEYAKGALWELVESMRIRPVDKPYLVPATKALHHLLPDLVVPVDGNYTTEFFGWSRNDMLSRPRDFFFEVMPVLAEIAKRIEPEVRSYIGEPFHRTLPKIVDNAIAGFVTSTREKGAQATRGRSHTLEESKLLGASSITMQSAHMRDADRIRQKALESYFEPARQRRLREVTIVSGDLHRKVGLHNRYRNVCQALAGDKLRVAANVDLVKQEGPRDSSTTRFTYRLL